MRERGEFRGCGREGCRIAGERGGVRDETRALRRRVCGAEKPFKKYLSNAASNLEHMSFSNISVTHMEVRGESASGLKSLDMQREGGVRGRADAEERGGRADAEERGGRADGEERCGFALQARHSKARDKGSAGIQ